MTSRSRIALPETFAGSSTVEGPGGREALAMIGGEVVDGRTWSRGYSKWKARGSGRMKRGGDGRPSGGTAEALIRAPLSGAKGH